MKRTLKTALPALLAAILLLLNACGTKENTSTPSGGAQASGATLARFTAKDLQGNTVNQSVFAGHKLTMINVWATFCGPCIREMPDLGELSREYAARGFQVIGVVSDAADADGSLYEDEMEAAREIIEKTKADYLHLLPSRDLTEALLSTIVYVPTTIFVNEQGNQVGKLYASAKSKSDWKKIIDHLLEQGV